MVPTKTILVGRMFPLTRKEHNMEAQVDRRIKLPPARYHVDMKVVGRSHKYIVTEDSGKVSTLNSVTGVLGVIAKPQLIPWAANQASENAERALMSRLEGAKSKKITLTEEWIKGVIAEAKKAPEKIKTDAADLGTRAHAYFDQFIRGEAPEIIEDDLKPAVNAFNDWFGKSNLTIVGGDTKVASLVHGYGGALDFLAIDEEGCWVLGDFKTSRSGKYAEYSLQVSAYANAFKETYGISCGRAIILRFSKVEPAEFEASELCDMKNSFAAFLDAKNLKEKLAQEHFCP